MIEGGTPVDWHVHVHDPAQLDATLDTAAGHFARTSAPGAGPLGVLALAELPGQCLFAQLAAQSVSSGAWRLRPTDEPASLFAEHDGRRLALVAGFQTVTAERLEVLALGTTSRPPHGSSVEQTLAAVTSAGGIAVLPWGVGKWLGRRGRKVSELAARLSPAELVLGDNAGRPWFWPEPAAFRIAADRGIAILPGSDTLPGGDPSAGRVGTIVPTRGLDDRPAAALRDLVADPSRTLVRYGALERATTFARNQIGLRLRRAVG